jgi:hypothetical protein
MDDDNELTMMVIVSFVVCDLQELSDGSMFTCKPTHQINRMRYHRLIGQ